MAEDLCVSRVPLFQGLDHAEQVGVAAFATPTRFAAGEDIGDGRGDPLLLVVHTGSVKVSRVDAEGREQVLRVLGPGQFLGESSFLTGRPFSDRITALEPASMCVFRHADFARLVNRHPSIGMRMLQAVSRRLDEAEHRLAAVISGDVTARLADYLLELPGAAGPAGVAVRLPMAKKDIASLLDTSPESLSRQLRRLREAGIIADGDAGGLVIVDPETLMDLSRRVDARA